MTEKVVKIDAYQKTRRRIKALAALADMKGPDYLDTVVPPVPGDVIAGDVK